MRPLACAVVLAACQPRPPDPDSSPPHPADDLARFRCEHTSWPATSQHQETMRKQDADADQAFAEHARLGRKETTTHLIVAIIDSYEWLPIQRFGCEGIAPHHLEVLLDGRHRAMLDVPCLEGVQTPAREWALPPFDVPPGLHRLRVRELVNGVSTARDMMFPDEDHDVIEVYASENQFAIQDLSDPVIRM